jgi:hypothetical protein
MKSHAKTFANTSAYLAASIFLLCALAASLHAQGRNSSTPSPAAVARNAEQDMMSREWNLTHIPDQVNGQFKTEQVSVFRQVQEDFTNIQVTDNRVMKAVFVEKSLDYKMITAATEEIKKRAVRLRGNLLLPKAMDKDGGRSFQPPTDDEQLKAALLKLDRSVVSFVNNPLFKMSNAIDADKAAQAGRDLQSIIEFSDAIRKNVQNMMKSGKH